MRLAIALLVPYTFGRQKNRCGIRFARARSSASVSAPGRTCSNTRWGSQIETSFVIGMPPYDAEGVRGLLE